MFDEIFAQKKPLPARLTEYGFKPTDSGFVCTREIRGGEFLLTVTADRHGNIDTMLNSRDGGEEYTLYKTTAQGVYVGKIREEIAQVLRDISDKCFVCSVFKQKQTLELIEYAARVYGDAPEFLWESTPGNGILRRKESGKWYAAILTVPMSKLGLDSKRIVEIVDLHAEPASLERLLTRPEFYPGWHMNKKSWFTVILNGSIDNAELFELLDTSYRLAAKPARKRRVTHIT